MSKVVMAVVGLGVVAVLMLLAIVVGGPLVQHRTAARSATATTVASPSVQVVQQASVTPRPSATLVAVVPTPTETPPSPTPTATATEISPTETPPAASPTTEPTVAITTTPAAATTTPTGPWITLSPDSGPPGTNIEIDGYIPGGPTGPTANATIESGVYTEPKLADVCWNSCEDGLVSGPSTVNWSNTEPGRFTMQLNAPSGAWREAGGVHPVTIGDYKVSVQCIGPKGVANKDCTHQPAQATATFHLTGPVPTPCPSVTCSRMTLTPSKAPPGALVEIEGWAPLTQLSGSSPTDYALDLAKAGVTGGPLVQIGGIQQSLNGDLSGTFRVPYAIAPLGQLGPGKYAIVAQGFLSSNGKSSNVASATFELADASSWASLGALQPVSIQPSGPAFGQAWSSEPNPVQRIAYCASDGIHLSSDNGQNWSIIPTSAVGDVAAATEFPLFRDGQSSYACADVTLDPTRPDSYYARFGAYDQKYGGPPPLFYVGYVTTDAGKTWQPVNAPDGFTLGEFGGFAVDGTNVQAIFGGVAARPDDTPPFAVVETADGGHNWSAGKLTCPASGPCVGWGPSPSGIGSCAMHSYPRPIEVSTDEGKTWASPEWPRGANSCDANELVALSSTEVLRLAGGPTDQGQFPVLRSKDSGKTWEAVALPPIPGGTDPAGIYPGLRILPNGALLANPTGQSGWQMLASGASQWCTVRAVSLPPTPEATWSVTVIDGRLWWLDQGKAISAPLDQVSCNAPGAG